MTVTSKGTLHLVAFGSWQTRGNKPHLHLYLGKSFAGDWAMGKCCHMLFRHCFIWVTDSYAAWFLLSYNGSNQAVQCLQMHIMGWDVDIIHRAKTTIWPTQTIGWDSTLTCIMTQLSRTTFNLSQLSDCNQCLHLTCQSCQGTCHTTEVHESRLIHPPWLLTTKNTKNCWRTQYSVLHTHLEISPHISNRPVQFGNFDNPLTPNPVTVSSITMSSQLMHFLTHNSTGQSILSTLAILLHQSALVTSHSTWH